MPSAVLLDRDGTVVVDVPFNGDPTAVRPMPTATDALALLRSRGVPTAIVSNQSGIARGLLSPDQVAAVNARVDELLGPFDAIVYCPHGPADGCRCRKPGPGLIESAAALIGVAPADCAVIGDIGADVEAAAAAGAVGILVPTAQTRAEEITAAPLVERTLEAAVARILEGAW
jgi:histidinol-phosphate phosphatase family protein